MTKQMGADSTQDLIDVLEACDGIDELQAKSLTIAFSAGGSRTPHQVLMESGIFTEAQVANLVKILGHLECGKLSKEKLALFIKSLLMSSHSLDAALNKVEDFVNPPSAPDLPPVFNALLTAKQITLEDVEEYRKDASPQKNWKDFCVSKGVLKPEQVDEVAEAMSFIEAGELTVPQFSVCYFDMVTAKVSLRKSIQFRGWWPNSRPIP